jgi:hypothetical protein
MAFWTDDECSKLNINTASEPTYWAPPIAFHDRDYEWAIYQPMRFEYQRYPGHPATIALSTVLFPNKDSGSVHEDPRRSGRQIRDMKERIFDIMPKINRGGFTFWHRAVLVGHRSASTAELARREWTSAVRLRERLYASVDELLFLRADVKQQQWPIDHKTMCQVPACRCSTSMLQFRPERLTGRWSGFDSS